MRKRFRRLSERMRTKKELKVAQPDNDNPSTSSASKAADTPKTCHERKFQTEEEDTASDDEGNETCIPLPELSPSFVKHLDGSTMQSDTNRTFEQIHGSSDTMLAAIKRIQHLGIVRDDAQAVTATYIRRVLKPIPFQPRLAQSASDRFLELTCQISRRYVAVSYTWDRSDPSIIDTPHCRIIMPDGSIFEPHHGLNAVIHRALEFGPDDIWLDQVCILQNDKGDLEWHLQRMHKVFAESSCTFVPLSSCVTSAEMLETLGWFGDGDFCWRIRNNDAREAPSEVARRLLALFQFLVEDSWFKRAWTYHERQFGANILLSIHVARILGKDQTSDIAVSMAQIKATFGQVLDWYQKRQKLTDSILGKEMWDDLERILRMNFDFGRKEVYRTTIDDHCVNGHDFDVVETRDITFVSDRLQILANVRGCIYKLQTVFLNKSEFSYSTCLLVLLMSNGWRQHRANIRSFLALRLNSTITDVVKALKTTGMAELHISVDHNVPYAPCYFTESPDLFSADPDYVLIPILAIDELENYAAHAGREVRSQWLAGGLDPVLTRRLTRHDRHVDLAAIDRQGDWVLYWSERRKQEQVLRETRLAQGETLSESDKRVVV